MILRVLLALTDEGYSSTSLESVLHIIRNVTAELHVLRVVPPSISRHPVYARVRLRDAGRIAERTIETHRNTCESVVDLLGDVVPSKNVRTQPGELVEQLTERAGELRAELVVLPPSLRNVGTVATSLARSTRAPVLVPRSHVENGAIFAATDLRDPSFRVLECGSQLAKNLQAPLVTFHNIDPLPAVNAHSGFAPNRALSGVMLPLEQGAYLAEASKQLPNDATSVVRSEIDPVQSILAEADARCADVVVVGTHYRSWWERVLSGSVASRVIARAERSVLVTPIAQAPTSTGREGQVEVRE